MLYLHDISFVGPPIVVKRSEWYSNVNLHQNAKYLDVFKPDAYFLVDWPLASAQKIT